MNGEGLQTRMQDLADSVFLVEKGDAAGFMCSLQPPESCPTPLMPRIYPSPPGRTIADELNQAPNNIHLITGMCHRTRSQRG